MIFGPAPSAPKLGSVTILLPPFTETPGIGGFPVVPLPAPPAPGYGEIPPRAVVSDPRPVPSFVASAFAAPEPSPDNPLPGPAPRPMPDPPPDPPSPGLSPPDGDMAIEPAPPLPGTPILDPGWFETTMPVPLPLPPLLLGGAVTEPASIGPPRPAPRFPRPRPKVNLRRKPTAEEARRKFLRLDLLRPSLSSPDAAANRCLPGLAEARRWRSPNQPRRECPSSRRSTELEAGPRRRYPCRRMCDARRRRLPSTPEAARSDFATRLRQIRVLGD